MLSIWNRFIFCCICILLNKVQKCKISHSSVLFVVASCFAYLNKMQSLYQWYHICEYIFILAKYYFTNWIFYFYITSSIFLAVFDVRWCSRAKNDVQVNNDKWKDVSFSNFAVLTFIFFKVHWSISDDINYISFFLIFIMKDILKIWYLNRLCLSKFITRFSENFI